MTDKQLIALAKDNALTAIDQAGSRDYQGLHGAIDSYFENLGQTLAELGIGNGRPEVDIAYRAFAEVLAKHSISYRPHGCGY